uniref:Uncharacterized protein n=1 Tax=Vespula pensylvanica TaxID=30213 RepID=A0A834P2W2_VESPE|nr:hypothetical protein H0235_008326 [Vespula pensylvanica]
MRATGQLWSANSRNVARNNFPKLRKHAPQILSLFGSTYICNTIFSIMNINKSELRPKLTEEHLQVMLRIHTIDLEPRSILLLRRNDNCTNPPFRSRNLFIFFFFLNYLVIFQETIQPLEIEYNQEQIKII